MSREKAWEEMWKSVRSSALWVFPPLPCPHGKESAISKFLRRQPLTSQKASLFVRTAQEFENDLIKWLVEILRHSIFSLFQIHPRDPLPKESNYRVGGDSLEPVIVEVEENHLRLCGFKDEIPKFLHLKTSLEGELELGSFDHNVGEVQQVYLRQSSRSGRTPRGLRPTFAYRVHLSPPMDPACPSW